MLEILKSEFFWGIIIGLLLSVVGGWAIANFTVSIAQKHQKEMVVKFVIDTIKNLQNVVREMDSTRDKSKAIHPDFLALLDVEIGVYGRNREQLLHLPEPTRDKVRKFMNDCAIKRAEITQKLDQFYKLDALANQVQTEGRGPEARRIREQSIEPLKEAQKAADKLLNIADRGSEILTELSKLV